VRFTDAYCNSPICVPSRASFQTGRYVHDIRFWDNCIAYDGSVPSWAHRLREAGHRVDSIGKLHFRSAEDDNGFSEEHMPLHIVEGLGDPIGMLRDPPPRRVASLKLAVEAGCGDSTYQGYDDRITEAAEDWLRERAQNPDSKPWMLFVSLVCPHFPLISRPEWYNLYPEDKVPCHSITRRRSVRVIPSSMRCARVRFTMKHSTRKRRARQSPPISASSASSTTMSDAW
jgi:choline-sulfatase